MTRRRSKATPAVEATRMRVARVVRRDSVATAEAPRLGEPIRIEIGRARVEVRAGADATTLATIVAVLESHAAGVGDRS